MQSIIDALKSAWDWLKKHLKFSSEPVSMPDGSREDQMGAGLEFPASEESEEKSDEEKGMDAMDDLNRRENERALERMRESQNQSQ
ncbi:MAG: hypothetical protein AAB378_00960 [Patescibacteria group bacterium]